MGQIPGVDPRITLKHPNLSKSQGKRIQEVSSSCGASATRVRAKGATSPAEELLPVGSSSPSPSGSTSLVMVLMIRSSGKRKTPSGLSNSEAARAKWRTPLRLILGSSGCSTITPLSTGGTETQEAPLKHLPTSDGEGKGQGFEERLCRLLAPWPMHSSSPWGDRVPSAIHGPRPRPPVSDGCGVLKT